MTENYVDWAKEDLIKEIKKLKKRKKYGIVWEEKTEKVAELCREKLPVFKEVRSKEIKTDEYKLVNILIEGDNYHALSVLNYTHKGAIDVIYIDPPYNTGHGDEFRYNDKIIDINDAYRHSKWLSFLKKRLKLAKNLLRKTGVIFISIDDNEIAQLKLLCDEIFYEKNFVGVICWKHRHSISNDLIISQNHNYILVYAKQFDVLFKNRDDFRLEKEFTGFSNPDDDPRGPYKLTPVDGPGGSRKGNPYFEFLGVQGYFRYSPGTMQELYENGLIVKRTKTLAKKYFLSDAKKSGGRVVTTWWDGREVGTTTEGTRTLNSMIGKGKFNNPKPVRLIKRIVKLATTKSGTVLDFFAGSGTTGHAVLELNDEDNGNRKFILCTNNENNICTEVCYPRMEKAIKGYKKLDSGKQIKGTSGNLKYFRTTFVESEPTDRNKKKLVDQSTEMLCLKESCFNEIRSDEYFKIFKSKNGKYLGIIYDDEGIETCKTEIKKINKKASVYVFSLDTSAREEDFEDMIELVDLKPIPEVILNVYRRIFR